MLIPKFYLSNSTNIEYLLWARHCSSSQDESMKKVDQKKKKKKKKGKEGTKTKTFYFGISNSDLISKLSNTFEGFCAPLDYFRLSGFAEERRDFTIRNFLTNKAMRICTTDWS